MASEAPSAAFMAPSAQHQQSVNNFLQQQIASMKASRVQQCGLSPEQALLTKANNVASTQSTPDLLSLLMMQQMQQFPTPGSDTQLTTRQSSGSVTLNKTNGVNIGLGSISAPQLMLDAQLSSPVPVARVSPNSSISNVMSGGNSAGQGTNVTSDNAHDYLLGRMSGSSNGSGAVAVGFSPPSNMSPTQDNNTGLGLPGSTNSCANTCFQVPRLDRVSELSSGASPQDAQPHILHTAVSVSGPSGNGQAGAENSNSNTASPAPAAPSFPSTLTVSGTTDIAQAANLVNLALSQPSVKSFVVVAPLGAPTNTGSMAAVCAALRVATTARRMHQATGVQDSDLAIMPMFNAPGLNNSPSQLHSIDLHVYQVKGTCRIARGSVPSLRVDPTGNAQVLAQQLTQAFTSGQHSAVEVVFGSASARLALLTLAQAQLSMPRSGQRQNVMLLPVSDQSNAFSVLMVQGSALTTQQAESEDLHANVQAALAGAQAMKKLLDGGNNNISTNGNMMLQGSSSSLVSHPSGALSNNYGSSAALSTLTSLHSSPLQPHGMMMPPTGSHADLAALLQPFSQMNLDGMNNAGSYDQAAGLNPLLNLSRVGSMHAGMAGTDPHSSMAALAYQAALASSLGTSPGTMMPSAFGGLGMGGILDAAGAGAAAAAMAVNQAAAVAAAQQQANANKARARKADWVIVTEDTAIKNAAGAIAKVLGRMAHQGLCCPVYMERKTSKFTSVVSVAVKAIAVARGYVSNEGGGHEVGFQPYVRGDACACAFGTTRPPGAPALSTSANSTLETLTQLARGDSLSSQLLSLTGNNDLATQLLQHSASTHSLGALSPRASAGNTSMFGSNPLSGLSNNDLAQLGNLLGASPLLGNSPPVNNQVSVWTQMLKELGMNDVNGGSDGSSVCDDDGGPSWSELEQVELAFDVYKVHLPQEIPDAGNLPVKVTAHSRPGVVANIISKLVVERGAAVLITAGGRAMHVAMLAIVTARQRLQSQGADILLLPKFVTVDTTSTLGWESVFLRFSIVKWSPVALGAANDLSNKLSLLGRTSL